MGFFHRLVFELSPDREDIFVVELFARGALGVEVKSAGSAVRLVAHCPDPLPQELQIDFWSAHEIELAAAERFEDRDWLAAYREASRPIELGERFLVDPGEPDSEVSSRERILLRVPARRAFGTGSHESTRLIMEWLEGVDLLGLDILDVGCGSAILSMAAECLGARSTLGIDIDLVACLVAHEIVALNGGRTRLAAGGLACLGEARFDLALVNIRPHFWLDDAELLSAVVSARGELIVSGLLLEQVDSVSARLARAGFIVAEQRSAGEWAALRSSKGEAWV